MQKRQLSVHIKRHLGQKVLDLQKIYIPNSISLLESCLPSLRQGFCGGGRGEELQTWGKICHLKYALKRSGLTRLQTMKLLVTGLPGVGKTSLLQALADTAPNPAGFLTLEVLKMNFSISKSDLMSLTL